jgi:hypothetical protein
MPDKKPAVSKPFSAPTVMAWCLANSARSCPSRSRARRCILLRTTGLRLGTSVRDTARAGHPDNRRPRTDRRLRPAPIEFLAVRILAPASRCRSAAPPMSASLIGRSGSSAFRLSTNTVSRSKRTYDLTSSVVPRGTSFHRSVELEFPPIAFNPAWLSCCHQSTRCDRTQHPRQALRSRQCLPYWADKIVSYIPEWRTVSPQIDF